MKVQGNALLHLPLFSNLAGLLLMFSAALLFTLSNIVIKLLGPEYSSWHIAFYRFFGGMVVTVIVFGGRISMARGRSTPLLLLRGGLGVITFLCFISAVRMLPVSTALVIVYSFPAFSAIFSYLIFKEKVGAAQINCIGMAIFGIVILLDFRTGGHHLGYMVALITSAMAGLMMTLVRELRKTNGPVIIYLYYCSIGAALTLPKFIMNPLFPQTSAGWTMIAAIVLTGVIGQLLMNYGFKYCRGWEGGVMMSSEALFTVAAGIWLLNDPVTWRFFVGGMIIFVSSVMLNRMKVSHSIKR